MNKKEIVKRAKKIKLIAMDIDGVLTGGEIIILQDGQEVKFWNVKDRIAFHFAKVFDLNLRFAWITGRSSQQIRDRADEIGIDALYKNVLNKGQILDNLCERFSLSPQDIAYIGDDLIDLPLLTKVGFAASPSDAVSEVKNNVHFVSDCKGGRGVFREVLEVILKSQGKWRRIVKEYLK
ncbi:MAG: HAD hydrolase family protein [bacterium]